ncbi:MAG: hypothetical protein NW224_04850 [Leptolyngbyaceae cyanobacterium bins.302]|nr:hypothetical protein [Leptolyngbyaceae cyanobacterium bins.302]
MTTPVSIRQKAIALVEQLPEAQLVQAVEWLEALSGEPPLPAEDTLSASQEEPLLEIIQRRLSPNDQARLGYLRHRNEAGIITDTEHQELLRYVEQVEHQDAERAAALIQLAQLRNVDLKVLVKQFLPIPRAV